MAPFGQVDSSLSRKYEGTGLGLSLTRHLVDLHEGQLTLQSRMGQGTQVAIVFPSHRVLPASAPFEPRRIAGTSAYHFRRADGGSRRSARAARKTQLPPAHPNGTHP